MHVVLVNPEYPPLRGKGHGGIATYIYTLANALSSIGHQVTVLIKKGTTADELDAGVDLHTFEPKTRSLPVTYLDRWRNGNVVWEKNYSRGLKHRLLQIHRTRPITLVELPEYNGLAYYLNDRLPFPTVIHFHTPSAIVDRYNGVVADLPHVAWYRFEARALRYARAYKCTSNSLSDLVSNQFGIARDRITVIRNPMPVSAFDAIERRDTPGRIDLLFVGRLERRKGAQTMLHAIQGILSIDPRLHITFAGETDIDRTANYRDAIERIITDDERKRVWFLGAVDRKALPVLFRRSGFFIFPSLFDNAPNALFEAMAAELPVIAADAGGVNEILRHNENGLLFPVDDPVSLQACIRQFIADPALPSRLAATARREIESLYTPQSIARQTAAFYETIQPKRS